jgi:2-polyprenyl-3-methyl-5-hydroxy-6-metoxy-1,4-benzoquinol methylase
MQYIDEHRDLIRFKKKDVESCPICGKIEFKDYVKKGSYKLLQCEGCGIIFVNPQPELNGQGFYDEGYYSGNSAHKENLDNENVLEPKRMKVRFESCQAVVEMIMQHHSKPGKWLDIGCGPGFLLSQAETRGWKCTGIDPSPFATAYSRDKFNLIGVQTSSIEDANFTNEMFDVISMQHVIEHFFNPLDTMRRIIAWLKPGGFLYLETPDIGSPIARYEGANWEHIKLPEHVVYFSESTLRYLLEQLSCEIVLIHHPVEGTGLMNKVCGGKVQARRFYGRYRENPIFRTAVRTIRHLNELYRSKLRGESDIIHILARRRVG